MLNFETETENYLYI